MPGYRPFAKSYFERGWSPIPLPDGLKKPPPSGWTGQAAPYPSMVDVEAWIEVAGEANIGLRLPFTVIGIDVDCYDGKPGAREFAALIDEFGPLPATVRSTSRDDGISGIRFYRVPADWRPRRRMPNGIDLIWAGHRYAVVYPSRHPNGNTYAWLGDDGGIPYVENLPDLPRPWLDGLGRASTPERGGAAEQEHAMPWVEQRSRWDVERIETGRHNWLASYAGYVATLRLSRFEAVSLVEAMADRCVPGRGKSAGSLRSEARRALDDFLRAEQGARAAEPNDAWSDVGLDEVVAEDVETLWGGLLVVGALNLLIGEEGTGKSLLAANLLVRASRGELSPDGRPLASLVIGAEDSIEAVWKPRCFAAGERDARLIRFRPALCNPLTGEIDEAPEFSKPAVLNSLLARWARKHGPSLIYLDHLSAVVPSSADTLKYDDAGGVLRAVNALAEKHGHCVIGGWHFNKGSGRVRSRVMNSTGVLASVRNAVALVRSEDDGARYVALVKSATGDTSKPAVRFSIGSIAVMVDGRARETARAHNWARVVDDRGGLALIEDVLARNDERSRSSAASAADWLRITLEAFGPLPRTAVLRAAKELGYGVSTIERAATRLGAPDGNGNWGLGTAAT